MFPSAELVQHAADLLPHIGSNGGRGAEISEGPRWEIVVSPGVIRVRTRDYARAERRHEREVERHRKDIDMDATWEGEMPESLPTRGAITGWTRKSRARLVERLGDLDYTRLYGRFRICSECGRDYDDYLSMCPACGSSLHVVEDRSNRLPAMLTLTYPGDWLTVAPDSATSMRHFQAFCKRYQRAWGEPLRGPWKKEFQRRGAPHFHISTTPPMGLTEVTGLAGETVTVDFRRWLSITWADIVNHPDPEQYRRHLAAGTGVDYAQGLKLTDPRRMAVYFAKYGTSGGKEYQHHVPKEWIGGYLLCTDCGSEYEEDRDECLDCGGLAADLVEPGTAGRFWGYRGLHRALARISTQLVRGKGLGEFVVEGAVAPPGDGGVGEVGLA
ncbi:MAG: rolling circle replication-associated protein [Pseudonocardia sp.]